MTLPSEITGVVIGTSTGTGEVIVRSGPSGVCLTLCAATTDKMGAPFVVLTEDELAALVWALHEFAPAPDDTVDF